MTLLEFEAVPAVTDAVRTPGLVVMKFGGTSVGDTAKLKRVAERLVAARESGSLVVGVLSAMGSTTDELIRLAHEVSPRPNPREYDMLVSTGERISNALCAMAIHDLGHEAVSLTGSQAGIVTDGSHTKAKIVEVRARRILEALEQDRIVLVAGFQGVSTSTHDVTTLGRGGSDTTAVALAAALGADACEIFTDVDGVFTADPRLVPEALMLPSLTYEEMLEMSASGAKVMALRSIEVARSYGVKLRVRPTFGQGDGTWIGEEDEIVLEKAIVSGVTHDTSEAKIVVAGVPDRVGVAARIFRSLAEAGVNVDMIVQNVSEDGKRTDLTFTVTRGELARALAAIEKNSEHIGYRELLQDANVAKVSIIGIGMRAHPGVAQTMFRTLSEKGINIQVISTSEIKVSVLIAEEYVELAVRALYSAYELDVA